MPRLLDLLAARPASLVNYATLARELSLPQSTLKRYVALLDATFMIRMLPAWSANLGKRVVKSPKIMLTDTGLLSHFLGADRDRLRRDRTLAGHAIENFVMMELTKQLGWSRQRCEMFHFRTESGHEVDFVLEDRKGRLIGVEVKAKTSIDEGDLRGLRAFAELTGERFHRGVLLYVGEAGVPFGRNLHALPLSALW
jgi:predicted AAA+ superfamily ATPase